MRRYFLALLLCLPALAGGSLAAHAVGYAIATPDGHVRADLLAQTGHVYLERPMIVALTLALVFAVGALVALHFEVTREGSSPSRVAARPFLLLAPFAFLVQEHLERAFAGDAPLTALGQPAVLAGLALQIPFAVAAWLIARAVLRSARALAAHVRGAGTRLRLRSQAVVNRTLPAAPIVARTTMLAAGHAGRAPPSSSRI